MMKFKRTTLRSFFPLLLLILWCSVKAQSEESEVRRFFHSGNSAYEKGDYEKALSSYRQIESTGLKNGGLFYNLGNIHFRKGDIGRAIYYFRKAKYLLPRDPDVQFNLQYVRNKTEDKIKMSGEGLSSLIRSSVPLNLTEALYLALFSSLLFWPLNLILLFRRNDTLKWSRNFLTLPLAFSFIFLLFKFNEPTHFGVIVDPEAKVYSGVGKDNVVLFSLHEGAEFLVQDQGNGEWIQIRLADGKKGWIRKKSAIWQS